ncbi:hypothetical protein [Vibrio parahaemolyticus]|uniref:hypothetical protein n=1 Tax=Vibrio parahaemolyticus TaxID=670 RepID=UPI00235FD875|nr:hypothetical protein [Vibrio parahaemolyticus]
MTFFPERARTLGMGIATSPTPLCPMHSDPQSRFEQQPARGQSSYFDIESTMAEVQNHCLCNPVAIPLA